MTIDERELDEAIQHAREVAEIHRNNDKLNKTLGKSSPYYNTDCIKCAKEHEQLAELLEELKAYKKNSNTCPMCDTYCSYIAEEFENGYNKAIDDFVKALQEKIEKDLANPDLALECKKCGIWKNYDIAEIAEQLKAGGDNEQG